MTTYYAYNFSSNLPENYGNFADTYELYANKWLTQIHAYGGAGDDTLNLYFEGNANTTSPQTITATSNGVSHGHHGFADAELSAVPVGQNTYSFTGLGSDTFRFDKIDNVKSGAVIVGRLDDFDNSRD